MSKLTQTKLRNILTERLHLKSPVYRLGSESGRIGGLVISPSFRGKGDSLRQKEIWEALEAGFGVEASRAVGMLLAYTPEEWNAGVEAAEQVRAKRAG